MILNLRWIQSFCILLYLLIPTVSRNEPMSVLVTAIETGTRISATLYYEPTGTNLVFYVIRILK